MDIMALTNDSKQLSQVSSYQTFVNYARSIPMLNEEQETELLKRFKLEDDLDAAKQLILSHLRFVVHIANSYRGYGLPMEDIVQEGNVGLMKSVKRFDMSYGVRLASFAVYWIKSEIHDYVLKNWRMVKVATTKATKKLFFGLRKFKSKLAWLTEDEVANVAKELGVNEAEVRMVETNLQHSDVYFENTTGEQNHDDYDPSTVTSALLADTSQAPEKVHVDNVQQKQQTTQLSLALKQLDERSRDIIESRWLHHEDAQLKLEDLAQRYNISAERVRQIESTAMAKIKRFMASSSLAA
ncbi:RNA polymerase sigma factor RpoH [Planctobacterium marinum]|uniref:RNA polymerase sigma factor RpoH n=1 Tax=Planctobacterium marinum TaxID=1631968 RepID=UPI001E518572|nr:RNA polymerase sigma factor RpoH [Planctobacterium marinum]MCC2607520.1 RNA polymerase sigma factor RpoH [Planctobacterium marinum]